MRSSVLLHPLCAPLAQALVAAGTPEYRVISICLGHLDAQALQAARVSLTAIDCPTGPTINDSLLISTRPPTELPSILTRVTHAASTRLGYTVNFKYLPHLTKLNQPCPDLASIATALHLTPPPTPSDALSSNSSPGSSRSRSQSPRLPRPASSTDSESSPTPRPSPVPPDHSTLSHLLNPEPPPPAPTRDNPDVVNRSCPPSPHSNPSPQLSHSMTPEPIHSTHPSESPPPSPLRADRQPLCSLYMLRTSRTR